MIPELNVGILVGRKNTINGSDRNYQLLVIGNAEEISAGGPEKNHDQK